MNDGKSAIPSLPRGVSWPELFWVVSLSSLIRAAGVAINGWAKGDDDDGVAGWSRGVDEVDVDDVDGFDVDGVDAIGIIRREVEVAVELLPVSRVAVLAVGRLFLFWLRRTILERFMKRVLLEFRE